jgi:uncharacterized RmlC-like cupin family protein
MDRERGPCKVVRPGAAYRGKQDLNYHAGLTAATCGSRAICMTVATLPPGARAKAHLHRNIETAIYVMDGEAVTWFGPELADHVMTRAGEYLYISPDTPHLVVNASPKDCTALIAHTAPDDQAGIVLLPELDARIV